MKRLVVIFILMAQIKIDAANGQAPALQSEETLCGADEDIYFSCPLINGKTISICAKSNTSPSRGYVKYRYGERGQLFTFPQENIPPDDRFSISDVSEGSIHGFHLKISNKSCTYIVSSVWPGEVYASKEEKLIFDKECQASKYKSFRNKIFDGIRQVPQSGVDLH